MTLSLSHDLVSCLHKVSVVLYDCRDINLTEPAQRPMYFEEIKKHIPQKSGDAQLESHDVKDKACPSQCTLTI